MLTKKVSISIILYLLSVFLIIGITASDETTQVTNIDTTKNSTDTEDKLPSWTGYLGCIIASIFFGSNLLPVKQFSAGDGVFFQFVYCVAVWAVGLIVDLILKNERFYPLVLVGGVLWTTGNMVTVFCIKTCGLSVGLLIWGTTSLIMGWAGGRFGIFGLTPQVPKTDSKLAMNYLGVIFAALSGVFFLFIKSTSQPRPSSTYKANSDESPLELSKIGSTDEENDEEEVDFPFLNKMSPMVQKIVGCTLAAFAGLFYGLMFVPDQYIRDHQRDYLFYGKAPPKNGLYYVNSQYSGILLSSMSYFIIYSIFKRNKPSINPSIALPAMVSGVMWAVANIGFIVAISTLSGAVAYPIVNVLPGIVSSLWSLFLFREIQGKKNLIFLGIGMLLRILAALLSGLSG